MEENQKKQEVKVENQNTQTSKKVEKQETIMDTANTKDTKRNQTKKKSKLRMILVILFVLIFAGVSYVQLRGSYLEYMELGEKYINVFFTEIRKSPSFSKVR